MRKKSSSLPGALPSSLVAPIANPISETILSTSGGVQPPFYPDSLPYQIGAVPEGAGLPSLATGQIWVGNAGDAQATTPTGSNGVEVDAGAGSLSVKLNVGGTAHQVLHGGTTPTMAAVDLVNDVTNSCQVAGPPPSSSASGTMNLAARTTTAGHHLLVQTSSSGDQVQVGTALQTGTAKVRLLYQQLVLPDTNVVDLDLDGVSGAFLVTNIGVSCTQVRGGIGALGAVNFVGVSIGFSTTQGNMGTVNMTGVMGGTSGTLFRVQNLTGSVANLVFFFQLFTVI